MCMCEIWNLLRQLQTINKLSLMIRKKGNKCLSAKFKKENSVQVCVKFVSSCKDLTRFAKS